MIPTLAHARALSWRIGLITEGDPDIRTQIATTAPSCLVHFDRGAQSRLAPGPETDAIAWVMGEIEPDQLAVGT